MGCKVLSLLTLCTCWGFGFDANLIATIGRYANMFVCKKIVCNIEQACEVLEGEKVSFACPIEVSIVCHAGASWLA